MCEYSTPERTASVGAAPQADSAPAWLLYALRHNMVRSFGAQPPERTSPKNISGACRRSGRTPSSATMALSASFIGRPPNCSTARGTGEQGAPPAGTVRGDRQRLGPTRSVSWALRQHQSTLRAATHAADGILQGRRMPLWHRPCAGSCARSAAHAQGAELAMPQHRTMHESLGSSAELKSIRRCVDDRSDRHKQHLRMCVQRFLLPHLDARACP
jgi:hypothetical protein